MSLHLDISTTKEEVIEEEEEEIIIDPTQIKQFEIDGYTIFNNNTILTPTIISKLVIRLNEYILKGEYDTGSPPTKCPSKKNLQHKSSVKQIVNIHKCDSLYKDILLHNSYFGYIVTKCMKWDNEKYGHGARLVQDQVWIKPPGAPPLAYHRDSPYFYMFNFNNPPNNNTNVATLWIALDDMYNDDIGPIRYVKGSHKWDNATTTTTGLNKQFFDNRGGVDLLKSVACQQSNITSLEDIEIITMNKLKAGDFTLHDGLTFHGSSNNKTKDNTRIGIGLHFIPNSVTSFTNDAMNSKLWKDMYMSMQEVNDDDDKIRLFNNYFPITYKSR